MKSGRASKTAEHNALFRALEARRPPHERVVADLLAVGFLSWPYRAVVAALTGEAGATPSRPSSTVDGPEFVPRCWRARV